MTEPHDERPHGLRPTYFFIAAGVTGVALISTVTFGALALSANGQFNDDATRIQMGGADVASLQAQGHDAASRARTMALVSDVSLAVTGAAAVATVVLLTQTRFAAAPVTVSPVVGANGGGLALSGRF